MKIQPKGAYVLGKEIVMDSGVVSERAIADTKQYYAVLAIGEGEYNYQHNVYLEPQVKVGDIVIIMKQAAEGDTPPDLYARGYALFPLSRIMAVSQEDN